MDLLWLLLFGPWRWLHHPVRPLGYELPLMVWHL